MALQIANPVVVGKVERLAKATGLSKTAVVEKALDRLIGETMGKKAEGAIAWLRWWLNLTAFRSATTPLTRWGGTNTACRNDYFGGHVGAGGHRLRRAGA